jgi:hypothetical protein
MTTSELDTLVPQAQSLEIAGRQLRISPLVIGELPAMLKAVRPFADQLAGDPDWFGLLSEHGDDLLDALALGSRQSRDWVDALALDDAITLATSVFEVNADFFVHRVVPKVSALAQGLNGRLAGVMPSPA